MDGSTALLEEIPRATLWMLDSCFAMRHSQSASINKHTALQKFYIVALHCWLYFKGNFYCIAVFKKTCRINYAAPLFLHDKLLPLLVLFSVEGQLLFFFLPLGSQCETLGSQGVLEYSPASSEGCEGPKQTTSRVNSPEFMENWVLARSLDNLSSLKLILRSLGNSNLSARRGYDQCGHLYKKKGWVESWRTWR